MPRNADVMVLCDELERRVVTPVVTLGAVVTRNQPKRDRAAYMRSYSGFAQGGWLAAGTPLVSIAAIFARVDL